ncbi:cytotoxic and regulatory T-cell molecule [Narcine bancroftii]|uniref:cytotoxic and regulatory T-cell molecule n=1 Tax=Narcine bancroftii TaxID=1343680 RepID=UPI00383207FF
MAILSGVYFLILAALQASSQNLNWENITVLEGNAAIFNCIVNKSDESFIEWKNPKQHVLYFNNIKALRDHRYKLVNYSTSQLIITLFNTTVDDEGMYSCLYYHQKITKKQVYLTILAPPSTPTLNITKHTRKEKLVSCITTGSKPKPQLTWLLNKRLELHGHTKYNLDSKGAKFTAISTLKIKAHNKNFTVECLVRHESLINRTLRATFTFANNYNFLGLTDSYKQTANAYISEQQNLTEVTTESEEGTTFNSTAIWNKANTSSIESENATSTIKCQNNIMENNGEPEKQQMKKNGALLLILVAFLICGLVIIFQLFVLKLWKEHLKWRKQKDESDTTGDSNRSNKSSNEENVQGENNNQEPNLQIKYITHTNSEEHIKQYANYILEDEIKESAV